MSVCSSVRKASGTLLSALCLATGVAEAPAQETGASMTIDGVGDLAWGTPAEEVRTRLGQSSGDEMLEAGLRMLAYEDSLSGRPSVLLLGFLGDQGLVKGQYVAAIDTSAACVEYIREVHRMVDRRYPLIRPTEEARNNSPDVICKAAAEGLAFWHRQWRDEESGAVVTVSLPSGSDRVHVTYESAVFRDWIRARAQVETVDVPDRGAAAPQEIDAVP